MTAINLTKTVNGPLQKVCDQWLIPVFLEKWMFNDETQEQVINLENSVRKGGEFLFAVSRMGKKIKYSGEYLEMRIPNHIAFTWTVSSMPKATSEITVRFEEIDAEKTRVKLSIKPDERLENLLGSIKSDWSARFRALANRF